MLLQMQNYGAGGMVEEALKSIQGHQGFEALYTACLGAFRFQHDSQE